MPISFDRGSSAFTGFILSVRFVLNDPFMLF